MADQSIYDQYIRASFRARTDSELTEVGLLLRATPLADAFEGRLPLLRELLDINEHFGVEIAQTVFGLALDRSATYGKFLRRIRSFDLREFSPNGAGSVEIARQPLEVTFISSSLPVPGRTDLAARFQIETWRSWAREMGFTTDLIETDPRLSLRQNGQLISSYLISNPHQRRLLITYGAGAAEFRSCLASRLGFRGAADSALADFGELGSIRAWINIAGAYRGASFARLQNESRLVKLKRVLSKSLGLKRVNDRARFWNQLDPRLPAWTVDPVFPREMKVINVVGFPLRTEMPVGLMASHDRLARTIGPNDGAVGLYESVAHPGLIVPVAGMSHRAEALKLEPILKRLLAIIAMDERSRDEQSQPEAAATNDLQLDL